MDKNQGSPFSTGRGTTFNMPDRKPIAQTNKDRVVPVPIDLDDLNHPGRGPVNYGPKKGNCLSEKDEDAA